MSGFPTKANWAAGDVLTAAQMDDLAGTVNYLSPVGQANGSTLVADSSTSTGLRYQGSAIGKNAVFNSGYDVFQRTTAPTTGITVTGNILYTLDRWMSWTQSGGGSCITSQQATGDTTNLPFVRYCARFRRATSNTDTGTLVFGQSLENTDSARFIGQTVCFSFYARKGANYSATSNLLNATLYSNTTTDAGLNTVISGAAGPISINATLTSTWQRFQGTATVSATATQLAVGFNFTPTGTALAADYFEVTGVQLELGSVATPFAKMGAGTIQSELAACQRYYYNVGVGTNKPLGISINDSTTITYVDVYAPVTMRTAPTIVQTTGASYYLIAGANQTGFTGIDQTTNTITELYLSTSALVIGQARLSRSQNASGSISLSAEL